jgi:alkanesulfonate monooxygenase SsuD/methylene tetrahydromethanopterin reductase-like flavin-dependent oxidoreductase (luciferase family)
VVALSVLDTAPVWQGSTPADSLRDMMDLARRVERLGYHPPLVVAEQFGTLEALHPGRIDLGIGRAPGTDPLTARALRRPAEQLAGKDFPSQLAELTGYFDGPNTDADEHPIHAIPAEGNRPSLWLLGSSDSSAELAGRLGLPYAYAHHIRPDGVGPALEVYRPSFRPSTALPGRRARLRRHAWLIRRVLLSPACPEAHGKWRVRARLGGI